MTARRCPSCTRVDIPDVIKEVRPETYQRYYVPRFLVCVHCGNCWGEEEMTG